MHGDYQEQAEQRPAHHVRDRMRRLKDERRPDERDPDGHPGPRAPPDERDNIRAKLGNVTEIAVAYNLDTDALLSQLARPEAGLTALTMLSVAHTGAKPSTGVGFGSRLTVTAVWRGS